MTLKELIMTLFTDDYRTELEDYDYCGDDHLYENGNSQTYQITMPSFEGFTPEETYELEEQYAQGFCDSIREEI